MQVGFFQFRPLFGKVNHNLNRIKAGIDNVNADLIVLPELPFTGYFFKDRQEVMDLSYEIEASPLIDSLVTLCQKNDYYLVTGFAEKCNDCYYNSAVLIGPEGVQHVYRKLHLFNQEKDWFDAGDLPLSIQKVKGITIGMMVCFDWIFPEVTRILALHGAQIICHPSNLVLSYCQQTMISRCLENNIFAITANRFGNDVRPHGTLRFTGRSQIVAPRGKLIYRAPAQRQTLFITEIDPNQAQDKNITAANHLLLDRRPEYYSLLSSL